MGNLIFFILHLVALIFGVVFLFVTIPLHLIYLAIMSKGKEPTTIVNRFKKVRKEDIKKWEQAIK